VGVRLTAAAIATVAGLAVAPGPAAAAPNCVRQGDDLVAQNATAVVIEDLHGDDEGLYGCLRASGRRLLLVDTTIDNVVVKHVRLNGAWVAWTDEALEGAADSTDGSVGAGNLTTGRVYDIAGYGESPVLADLVVSRRGSVAWIYATENAVRVIKCERGPCLGKREPEPALVARSPRIKGNSLTLSGRRLGWTDGGVRRYATLR
jgi:hypothetical protein